MFAVRALAVEPDALVVPREGITGPDVNPGYQEKTDGRRNEQAHHNACGALTAGMVR